VQIIVSSMELQLAVKSIKFNQTIGI